ncbi:MAG: tetratricopeptide repeat protein [Pseudomonadota bacterium]
MFKKTLSGLLLLSSMSCFHGAAYAEGVPSVHEIYQAANAGKLADAHTMIEQVIQAHPDSAKAHFVDAEILARQGAMGNAEREFAKAEKLAPGLNFAHPEAVQALRSKIAAFHVQQAPQIPAASGLMTSSAPDAAKPFPWNLLFLSVGAAGVVLLLIRAMKQKAAVPATGYPAPGTAPMPSTGWPSTGGTTGAPGYGGAAPMAPTSGGLGSSIVTGLATGAAVGAGVVAGEALMHHFMGGQSENAAAPAAPVAVPPAPAQPAYDMGGSDFGVSDNGSWDDTQNAADTDNSDDWS